MTGRVTTVMNLDMMRIRWCSFLTGKATGLAPGHWPAARAQAFLLAPLPARQLFFRGIMQQLLEFGIGEPLHIACKG